MSHGARSASRVRLLTLCSPTPHYYRVISVFLLVFNIVVLSFYFGMHCTPMIEAMIDYPDPRKFIGITSSVEIIAGILLIVGLASSLTVLSMVSKSSRGRGGALEFYNDFTYVLILLKPTRLTPLHRSHAAGPKPLRVLDGKEGSEQRLSSRAMSSSNSYITPRDLTIFGSCM